MCHLRQAKIAQSVAFVEPPHQLVAQGVEVGVSGHLQGPEAKRRHLDLYFFAGVNHAGAAVERHQKFVAAAVDAKADGYVVGHHGGAHVEVVGRDGGDDEVFGSRQNDGAAATQAVCRGSGGRAYDDAVCPVGVQEFVVDVHVDFHHGSGVFFVQGQLV